MPSKIIKGSGQIAESSSAREGKLIEREELLAHEEARRILEKAQAHARKIVEEAQAEEETLRLAAEQKGYQEGLAEWESRIAALAGESERLLQEAKPQLIQLAMRIAEKILRRHLDETPDAILPMIEEALEAGRGHRAGQLLLKVHPEDLPAVESYRERLLGADPRWKSLELITDEKLARGGCSIETEFGTIDASVETQLRAIEHILLGGEK